MNILLMSQCTKNALSQTRRILDQFAERRGDRTWQTAITLKGLQTLHKMLRKSARKNTAVACHWIHSKNRSELVWVVGDARRFNSQGATPTNITQKDILRSHHENDWLTAEVIRLLASMAALLHDMGKAMLFFQRKLKSNRVVADAYRHEWVSLRLFEAFVGEKTDEEWLKVLAGLSKENKFAWIENLRRDGLDKPCFSPFKNLPPLAGVVGWLIVSHHRVPAQGKDDPMNEQGLSGLPLKIESQWCGERTDVKGKKLKDCWNFKKGLPFKSRHWRQHISKVAQQILQHKGMLGTKWRDEPYILHVSRMALMLADHYYSGEKSHSRYGDADYPLYANTDRKEKVLKQRLDEHLIGVKVNANCIVHALPRLARQLPRIARHKGFRQRSKDANFRWQDRAFDLAANLREKSENQGFFGVNMASTGSGKTLANGRIIYALSDNQRGSRFSIAIGLRALTLQTGDVYRERLGLGSEDLAVMVGGGAIRELHEHNERFLAGAGSESMEDLLPENHFVHFEGSLEDGPLNRWLIKNKDAQKLLNAPILACTIDHLMPATEGVRGGRQIAPMLRLMTSDLVLDEPDDFGIEDLHALTRLVNWAGLLGSRVLLSSATLPPALVEGLFRAYLDGRENYQKNRGIPGQPLNVCCAWFDEFSTQASDHNDGDGYKRSHQGFVEKRVEKLAGSSKLEVRRKAEIKPLSIPHGQKREEICSNLAESLHGQIHELHDKHHDMDPETKKRISFGLIRMANIEPLTQTAKALYAMGARKGYFIHLCVYHAQHPLLVRSAIEKKLDRLLDRNQSKAIFKDVELRDILSDYEEDNHIFVVAATAVAEVGRDHDYDWAVVEPSSMRSIIQLAGRVRRHRPGSCKDPNIYLLDTNIRHLEHGIEKPAFCRPGFENGLYLLDTHNLSELLTKKQSAVIDSSARILERKNLQPHNNLVDLEHTRLRDLMLEVSENKEQTVVPVHWWWTTNANLSGELQRKQPFRRDSGKNQRYALLPDDYGEILLYRYGPEAVKVEHLRHPVSITRGQRIGFWGAPDYEEALEKLADEMNMETPACARRFGIIDLRDNDNGWDYHPALGFNRHK